MALNHLFLTSIKLTDQNCYWISWKGKKIKSEVDNSAKACEIFPKEFFYCQGERF